MNQSMLNVIDIVLLEKINKKADLVGGKIPVAQLPDLVTQEVIVIVEVPKYENLPASGAANTLYITTTDSILYRWSNAENTYIRIGGKDGVTAEELLEAIDSVMQNIPIKLSQLENDTKYITKEDVVESDPTVPAWAKANEKPTYTAAEVGALPDSTIIPTIPTNISAFNNDVGYLTEHQSLSGLATEEFVTVSGQSNINIHNSDTAAHNDLRLLIEGLTTRLNTIADSDDTTLDQISEIVTYIKNNKSLIDGITTSKVNVSDIIDNLTSPISNKPLSAAQGVALKRLIDAISIPTKLSQFTNDSGFITTESDPTVPSYIKAITETDIQSWNNKSTFSGSYNDLSNKPTIPTKTSQLTNDSGFITSSPVTSVNNKTGNVTLALADLQADDNHQTVTASEKALWNSTSDQSASRLPELPSDATDYNVYGLRARIIPGESAPTYYWEVVGPAPDILTKPEIYLEEIE